MNTTRQYSEEEERRDESMGMKIIVFMFIWLILFALACTFATKSDPACLKSDPVGTVTTFLYALAFIYATNFCLPPMLFMLFIGTNGKGRVAIICWKIFMSSFEISSVIIVIIGGLILFRSNSDCLKHGNEKTGFALVLWMIEASVCLCRLYSKFDIKC